MDDSEKRERLRSVERDLELLRREMGEPDDQPGDAADAAQNLEARYERDAQMELLENERERLRSQLGEQPDDGTANLPDR